MAEDFGETSKSREEPLGVGEKNITEKVDSANAQQKQELKSLDAEREVIANKLGINTADLDEVMREGFQFVDQEDSAVCSDIKMVDRRTLDRRAAQLLKSDEIDKRTADLLRSLNIDKNTEQLIKILKTKTEVIQIRRNKAVDMAMNNGWCNEKYYEESFKSLDGLLDKLNAGNN